MHQRTNILSGSAHVKPMPVSHLNESAQHVLSGLMASVENLYKHARHQHVMSFICQDVDILKPEPIWGPVSILQQATQASVD